MRSLILVSLFVLLSVLLSPFTATAQDLPTIATKTAGMEQMEGFFDLYWDEGAGKIWLEVDRFDTDFLYVSSLPAGLGSNDIGLDRGQLGSTQVVRFERVGPKILLVAPNLDYRASSDNPLERKAVEDAFAQSVVHGFTAAADTDGRVLVDATDFIVRDAHGVIRSLSRQGQGNYSLDNSRSAPYLAMTKSFPSNTEMEARLTFQGNNPGNYVYQVAADPFAITLRVRHSFIELPELGSYEPRHMDPRSGYFGLTYVDYATPIGEEKEKRFIRRHRLECAGPRDAEGLCTPVEPIVYYLDPGTPEPVRSALLEGGQWWAEAFEAAGFRDAYRVEMLPEGGDLMDVRYNVIQWVHRSTRGWSYGSSVSDPRTGEILKGHVSLGSLRVRQDYLLAEGLLAPYIDSLAMGFPQADDPMLQMALARIRQLSAHEIGHTIGIAHNFAASVNDRASVMDYPAPLATLASDGSIDLSAAYDTGIGEWDKVAVDYGYRDFAEGTDDKAALDQILQDARDAGLYYITDSDARPAGAAHPLANLWDNGSDILASFRNEMMVREVALNNFGLTTLREGRPLAQLEEVLVPLYLRHRYQVEATVKLVGGVEYSYALRGDDNPLPQQVPAELQTAAVNALLGAITPQALALPANIRTQLPPRPPGYGSTRELFDGYSGLIFDPYAPAEVAAGLVLNLLIHPERAARLAYQPTFDTRLPGYLEVLNQISEAVWSTTPREPYLAALHRVVQQVWIDAVIDQATRSKLAPPVRALTVQYLRQIHVWLQENPGDRRDAREVAHRNLIFDQIDRFLLRDYRPEERTASPATPPGSPIGMMNGVHQMSGPMTSIPAVERHAARTAYLERWEDVHEACLVWE